MNVLFRHLFVCQSLPTLNTTYLYGCWVSFQFWFGVGMTVLDQLVTVTDWPENFTGLSGTVTDRLAKVTDCIVTFPAQSICHHLQSGSLYLGQA